jgi:hypothetical protein
MRGDKNARNIFVRKGYYILFAIRLFMLRYQLQFHEVYG